MLDQTGTEIKVGNFVQTLPYGSVGHVYLSHPQYVLANLLTTTKSFHPEHFSLNIPRNVVILDRSLFTPLNPDLWTQDEKLARLAWLEEQCPDLEPDQDTQNWYAEVSTDEQEFAEEDLNSDLPEGNTNLYWSAPLFSPEDDDLPF